MMTKVKFIHTADIHLDTPFKGLSSLNRDLALKLKDATFKVFKRIVDLCINESVDFLIIAGDIFDIENKSLTTQIRFISEIKRLSEKGIKVYYTCGNHDPLNSWLPNLQFPENTFRFNSSEVQCITHYRNNIPVADIYGISYENRAITRNLARTYTLRDNRSSISIAILHGTIGSRGPHENYAPFSIQDVLNKGFDYWALGHIHQRQTINESTPAIVYPGNPQGRDFGEVGEKGCYIVEISNGNKPELAFTRTQLICFEELDIDLSGETQIDGIPERIKKARKDQIGLDENTNKFFNLMAVISNYLTQIFLNLSNKDFIVTFPIFVHKFFFTKTSVSIPVN